MDTTANQFSALVSGNLEKYTFDSATGNIYAVGDPHPSPRANINNTSGITSAQTELLAGYNAFKSGSGTYSEAVAQKQQVLGIPVTGFLAPGADTNAFLKSAYNPSVANISNPVQAPGGYSPGTPNLPTPQATNAAANYQTSLTSQIEEQKKALQTEADKRAAEYDKQIKELEQQQADMQTLQQDALSGISDVTIKEVADKKAALELEKQRFDENYNANQSLVGELDSLLSTGNALIEEMKGTTGLASIMNPRIAKTMSDVQARSGVIQAVLSARNGQMSYAQQQLGTTYDALSSMATDQINYYKTVMSFWETKSDDLSSSISNLVKDQKDYLDVKLNMLNADLTRLQNTRDVLSKAMMDPDTASSYARAGVTMNDSVEQIGQKLSQYAYSQELSDKSNAMATNGYSSIPQPGVQPTIITDSQGNQKAWYKISSGNPIEVSAGATLVDPITKKPIYTAPTAAQTTAAGTQTEAERNQIEANRVAAAKLGVTIPGATGGGASTTGKALTTVGFPPNTSQQDVTDIDQGLVSGKYAGQKIANPMGSDGFIDPAGYVTLMNFWIQQGGTKSAFLSKYPVTKYINPANTWVWGQIGIANPSAKKTTTTDRTS